MRWGEALRSELLHSADLTDVMSTGEWWVDMIDPCSGLPVHTRSNSTFIYPEVAGFEQLLCYRTTAASCCKVLLHPSWGSACYPATVFIRYGPPRVPAEGSAQATDGEAEVPLAVLERLQQAIRKAATIALCDATNAAETSFENRQ
jgi:hypothetical protein